MYFKKLKKRLVERPIVQLTDIHQDLILKTDASTILVGAILKQMFNDTKQKHLVAFFSRLLTNAIRNYCAYELEMYLDVQAVENL